MIGCSVTGLFIEAFGSITGLINMELTVTLEKTNNNLDIDRLHLVHSLTTECTTAAPRRAGSTYYNFDSLLRIVELQDLPHIFYTTLNPDGNEASRAGWYKREFIKFLQQFGEYSFYESMGIVCIRNVNIIFVTYDQYKKIKDGFTDHYLVHDI